MFSLIPHLGRRAEMAPWKPMDLLRREFGNLFDRGFNFWPVEDRDFEPLGFTMEEAENEVVVRAELPGFELPELDVNVTGNMLTMRAEHKEAADKGARIRERIERIMTLPAGLDVDKVNALYRNGVLELHFPRSAEARPRPITVKS